MFARQAKFYGVRKLSIALLVERLRWELNIVTAKTDTYKISNSHRAFYARKLMEMPEFEGLFNIRSQRS